MLCEYLRHEFWEGMERNYDVVDFAKDQYLVLQCHDFKMMDGKSVVDQIHDLQVIAGELKQCGMHLV